MQSTLQNTQQFKGNNSALTGIVLAVVTFWLFAQTTLNIGPAMGSDIGTPPAIMNIAISLSALFSGMFIVVAGGFADKIGRVKVANWGNILNIIGSLLVGLAVSGDIGTGMLLVGRILQGLSAAFIMPSTMALLKTYWEGKDRQRAVSMWSMGSWGGSGLAAVFGGVMVTSMFGWRSIFIMSAIISAISILLMRQIPEDAPAKDSPKKTDWPGIITLALFVLSLLLVVTQGSVIGWTNWITWALIGVVVISLTAFIKVESGNPNALVDFNLFRNQVFTGATISNLMINATAGLIPISLWVIQDAAEWNATQAGYLTIGYAVFIIAFIRVGEKLLQKFGAKKPMLWGAIIVIISIAMLLFTNTMASTYAVLVAISYCLFGLGLAFYATPSTDAALSSLPDEQAGAGSGVYKMASSLGAAFGAAIPTSIYVAMSTSDSTMLGNVIEFTGRQDNAVVREAGMFGMFAILIMALIALSSIILFVPNDAGSKKSDKAPTKATELMLEAEEEIARLEAQIAEAQTGIESAREKYATAKAAAEKEGLPAS
ncbi:MFS transporter [Corynebacterium cystitidis]|uniref:MFS transporter, DHA2 family, multidrug resistance protein n=1 Tax=Corynebacterium cystitidis DSM 20524 TaxID=1121357 RepID=A0A1H9R3N4_9CORY|nr:MFS transporter [Corynebacterium cystitidis]WJY81561.1 Quinolone resistance protein NorB [Corynebacterium cystitidis DSM 20524]SER67336.1 MFS transporter, DHA2 family, multidrug resistance protein [Corynebacterium cystitidis DSM 20524]SNV86187.1 major facilitator superfamily permease [Corynebacterium cystitidis]